MSDPTLDEMRVTLAAELPRHAAFDGWTPAALALAADATGIDPAVAALAFPGGAMDMIDAWFAHVDGAMLAKLPPETLATMKIRARIAALVEARLDLLGVDIEALRRALAVLADRNWRLAGDTATDFNHYSKRAILGGVYMATIMAMMDDDSEGHAETRAFLSRRIDGIMRFEKFKGRFTHSAPERLSLARFLGRLRYPAV
jgi:ubiquinone biosynthesis protein COQ9